MEEARRRVAAGAAFLDGELPGWRQYVDGATLDVSSVDACVLAQASEHPAMLQRVNQDDIHDRYWQMLNRLELDGQRAEELGFNYWRADAPSDSAAGQNLLTLEWRTLLGRKVAQ